MDGLRTEVWGRQKQSHDPRNNQHKHMRREERVTVQGPVKGQPPDGMSHRGGGGAQGLGIRLCVFGGAHWPLATAHSDPPWVRTCFGGVPYAKGGGGYPRWPRGWTQMPHRGKGTAPAAVDGPAPARCTAAPSASFGTRPTERSDPTRHAKGRTGDCPGPRKGATTRRNVTRGGGGLANCNLGGSCGGAGGQWRPSAPPSRRPTFADTAGAHKARPRVRRVGCATQRRRVSGGRPSEAWMTTPPP